MVIQECKRPAIEELNRSEGWSYSWFGGDPNKKGLGALAKPPWTIREKCALPVKWAASVVVEGPATIELFPIWADKNESSRTADIEQVHLLLDVLEKVPLLPFTIVAGDFNSNSMWDREDGTKNHTAAVSRFRELGLESAYHNFFGCSQGAERHPTHWNNKKAPDAPYHIDYIFLSRALLSKLRNVEVGTHSEWRPSSDHAPVLIELDV
jgi:exodeoxyribonuclease III